MAKVAVRRSSVASSLLTGLVSYWKLDETSGVRSDAHGTNHLTPSGTVTAQAGRVGNGAQMLLADAPAYLAKAAPVGLGFSSSFTVAWWSYVHTLGEWGTYRGQFNYQEILQDEDRWNIYGFMSKAAYNSVMAWLVGYGPGATYVITHALIAPNQWNLYVAWADATTRTIDIITNNGTSNAISVPAGGDIAGPSAGTPFVLGSAWGTDYADGLVDEVGIWSRLLTTDEKTALYNAGTGVTYPFTGV